MPSQPLTQQFRSKAREPQVQVWTHEDQFFQCAPGATTPSPGIVQIHFNGKGSEIYSMEFAHEHRALTVIMSNGLPIPESLTESIKLLTSQCLLPAGSRRERILGEDPLFCLHGVLTAEIQRLPKHQGSQIALEERVTVPISTLRQEGLECICAPSLEGRQKHPVELMLGHTFSDTRYIDSFLGFSDPAERDRVVWLGSAIIKLASLELVIDSFPFASHVSLSDARNQLMGPKVLVALSRELGLPQLCNPNAPSYSIFQRIDRDLICGAIGGVALDSDLQTAIELFKRIADKSHINLKARTMNLGWVGNMLLRAGHRLDRCRLYSKGMQSHTICELTIDGEQNIKVQATSPIEALERALHCALETTLPNIHTPLMTVESRRFRYSPTYAQDSIGYHFNDQSILFRALTHDSIRGAKNNQLFELIGDAVLEAGLSYVLAADTTKPFDNSVRATRNPLLGRRFLSDKTRELGLDLFVALHPSIPPEEFRADDKSMADLVEAVIGAIYQDGGPQAVLKFLSSWSVQPLGGVQDASQNQTESAITTVTAFP